MYFGISSLPCGNEFLLYGTALIMLFYLVEVRAAIGVFPCDVSFRNIYKYVHQIPDLKKNI